MPGAVGAGGVVAGEVRCAEDALRLQLALQGQVHLAGWARRTGVTQGPLAPFPSPPPPLRPLSASGGSRNPAHPASTKL